MKMGPEEHLVLKYGGCRDHTHRGQGPLRRTNRILLELYPDSAPTESKNKEKDFAQEILQQDIGYKHYSNNLDRIVLKDEIVKRQYYAETGQL